MLLHSHMFDMFITVPARTSDAVRTLLVDPIRGVALCEFTNGYCYEYKNVSRRAIANLLMNNNMSLGFWVNKNLVNTERTQIVDLNFYATPTNQLVKA